MLYAARISKLNLIGAAVCALMMGYALYAQHGLLLEPCNMCILQRFAVSALGIGFVLSALFALPKPYQSLWGLILMGLASVAMALALRQVWMQAQPLGSLPSCGADVYALIDMLSFSEAVKTVWNGGGECQAITWSWLGLSMAGWVFLMSLALFFMAMIANWPVPLKGLNDGHSQA